MKTKNLWSGRTISDILRNIAVKRFVQVKLLKIGKIIPFATEECCHT